ncbi:MAG TPA: PilZ domain-containing protein [Thermoanaerobaculia bacterium]|nr:PilZ domain-containing protein [Thermoanaerobaculia bacterium]
MALLETDELREYRRIAAGVQVVYRAQRLRRSEQLYLTGVADNVSLGGMFIATRHTFTPGTLITLEFHTSSVLDDGPPVLARALVCWRRRWRQPRGMGVRFVDFEGLGQRHLDGWFQTVLAPAPALL